MGVTMLNAGLDICYNSGPAYSPRLFEQHVLPQLQRITAAAHAHGLYYIYRTDGNTWPIAEMLFIRSGADGAGEIDIQAGMRLDEMREKMPELTLVGGVDCAGALVSGTGEDVKAETTAALQSTRGRRHIISASNLVMPETPTANYLAMIEAVHGFEIPAD
jgi:uroporphyrinogen decarboxylase